jgi:hypothetical protein
MNTNNNQQKKIILNKREVIHARRLKELPILIDEQNGIKTFLTLLEFGHSSHNGKKFPFVKIIEQPKTSGGENIFHGKMRIYTNKLNKNNQYGGIAHLDIIYKRLKHSGDLKNCKLIKDIIKVIKAVQSKCEEFNNIRR